MQDAAVQASLLDTPSVQALGRLPHPDNEFPQVLYRSHSVIWGFITCGLLYYFVLSRGDLPASENVRDGLLAVGTVLLFCSAVHLPDSHYMSRPHPVLWRILEGATISYIAFLGFVAFQSVHDARRLLAWFDPRLGVALPERNYAADCRVLTPDHPESLIFNIRSCILDVYILAHFLGWWLKMLIVRDVKLCWFLSIVFEFMEVSLRHQLPNFWECWWDSLLLDIVVCNGGGIYLGYVTCRWFGMRQYHWGLGKDIRPTTGRFSLLTRSAVQLTPFSLQAYKWDLLSSPRNFLAVLLFSVIFNLVDLSNFYLKAVLWIPASHWLLLTRVLFWACLSVIFTREYYEFVYSGFKERMGAFCWLGCFALALEWLIIVKYSDRLFEAEMPEWLKVVWTCIATGVIAEAGYLGYRTRVRHKA